MSPSKALRVLVVEDRAPVREAIAGELEPDPDFELVGQAASLAEAHTMLETIDVAILDLVLPDGSGADLIPELQLANPKAQAIVLSASVDDTLQARAMGQGAAAVLAKTEHLGQVARVIRRIVGKEAG